MQCYCQSYKHFLYILLQDIAFKRKDHIRLPYLQIFLYCGCGLYQKERIISVPYSQKLQYFFYII